VSEVRQENTPNKKMPSSGDQEKHRKKGGMPQTFYERKLAWRNILRERTNKKRRGGHVTPRTKGGRGGGKGEIIGSTADACNGTEMLTNDGAKVAEIERLPACPAARRKALVKRKGRGAARGSVHELCAGKTNEENV